MAFREKEKEFRMSTQALKLSRMLESRSRQDFGGAFMKIYSKSPLEEALHVNFGVFLRLKYTIKYFMGELYVTVRYLTLSDAYCIRKG